MRRYSLGILALLLLAAVSVAQPPLVVRRPSPTVEDYEKAFAHYQKQAGKALKLETWKDVTLKHKKTGEEKKLSDLTLLEQYTFVLMAGDRLGKEMLALDRAWELEIKKFADPKHVVVLRDTIENDKQKPAVKKDAEKYRKQLTDLRRQYATAYERFAEKMMRDFRDKLDDTERATILRQIRSFNDRHKLVERKEK